MTEEMCLYPLGSESLWQSPMLNAPSRHGGKDARYRDTDERVRSSIDDGDRIVGAIEERCLAIELQGRTGPSSGRRA